MFERVIFQNLIANQNYGVAFLPFLKGQFFQMAESKIIFSHIEKYFIEYKTIPYFSELAIALSNDTNLNEDIFHKSIEMVEDLKKIEECNIEWLSNETKKWIRNKAFEQVIIESAERLGSNKSVDDMMEKVKDVFSINFNESIGNNFFRDCEKQHDFYTQVKEKFESNISILNTCCDGGVERKTLNLLMAPTNTGKTSAMVSLASGYLRRGYNILYITCEMSEENIRQRVDANFLQTSINEVPRMAKDVYMKRMNEFSSCYKANLYVKEYPTATANVNHLRALLDALATKENFYPDIVFIDYLNIMCSARFKNASLYETGKAIAEEIRGLAVQYNIAIWSATQTNRSGDGASDLELGSTSDSYGVPMTVDMQIAVIQTAALLEQRRQVWKILKTRYSEMKDYKFTVEHRFETCSVTDVSKDENSKDENSPETKRSFIKNDVKEKINSMGIDFE